MAKEITTRHTYDTNGGAAGAFRRSVSQWPRQRVALRRIDLRPEA